VAFPRFPEFKPLELSDRDTIRERLRSNPPLISELTFTNLFMWLDHYRFEWSLFQNWLMLLSRPAGGEPYFLQPVGPKPRRDAVCTALEWLRERENVSRPRIERADAEVLSEMEGTERIAFEAQREHFDYVYQAQDLIRLSGRKYHDRKNHVNRFIRKTQFAYVPFSSAHAGPCLDVIEKWCDQRECKKYPVLLAETNAVKRAIAHFDDLFIQGGVVLVEGRIEAFTLGEMLNADTAVIHAEKADPDIPGLFAVINQQFCEHQWAHVPFINREQDLGLAGLRRAKLSYNPVRFVEKHRITLESGRIPSI